MVLAVVAASLVAVPGPARACSCDGDDLRASLERADGALVGTFLDRDEPQPDQNGVTGPAVVEHRFRVDETVKGQFGPTVGIMSASQGSMCGIDARQGVEAGLLVRRGDDGRWHGSLCETFPADALRGAAKPLPPIGGRGPPAVLLGGRFGGFRTVALDGAGRVFAYGQGEGTTEALAVCPGSEVITEAVDSGRLSLRRARDLSVMRDVARPAHGRTYGMACYAVDGSDVFAHEAATGEEARTRIVRIRGTTVSEVWQGPEAAAAFLPGHRTAIATFTESERAVVVSVDLPTGKVRRLFEHPSRWARFAPDSTGRWLLAVVPPESATGPSQVVLVDTAQVPPSVLAVDSGHSAAATWAGDQRIAVQSDNGTLRLLDRSLRERWSAPTGLGPTVAQGDTLYGLIDGGLSATSVERPSAVRTVFQTGGGIQSVAVVPPPPPPDPPATTTTTPAVTTIEAAPTTTTTNAATVLGARPLPPHERETSALLLLVALSVLLAAAGATAAAARNGPSLGATARRSAAHGTLR